MKHSQSINQKTNIMRQLLIVFIGLLAFSGSTYAAEETAIGRGTIYDGSKYIFAVNGIEFSVFPDGEFDFYIPNYVEGVSLNANAGPIGISFNTGFNYDPFVQYDDFGAVIQIEDTPIYYDNYGRIAQAGDINITYRNNRVRRVGGLQIFYNTYGNFSHYTGFINVYNRSYVFHPFHNFYYRPVFNRCLVWTTPYRLNFNPIRFGYAYHATNYFRGYNNGYRNARRDFRRPDRGRIAHNNGRRDNVDRNNARFIRANTGRVASISNDRGRSSIASSRTALRNGLQSETVQSNTRRDTKTSSRVNRSVASRNIKNDRLATSRPQARTRATTTTSRGSTVNANKNVNSRTRAAQSRPVTRSSSNGSKARPATTNRAAPSNARRAKSSSQNRATTSRGNSSRTASKSRATSSRKAAPRSTSRSSNKSASRSSNTSARRR